jgi:hypothetical protein
VCDGCGSDLGNGSIFNATIVSRMNYDIPGQVENLHFCVRRDDDIKPCSDKLLTPSKISYYLEQKGKT